VLGMKIFNDCHLLEEEVFTPDKKGQLTKDSVDLAKNNILGMLFGQGYRKKKDPSIAISVALSNGGFNPTNFITKVQAEGYK